MADLLGQLLDLLASNMVVVGQGGPKLDFGLGMGAILETIPISDCDADPIFRSIPTDVAESVLRGTHDDEEADEDVTSQVPLLNANARPFYPLNVDAPEYVPLAPRTDASLADLSESLGVPTAELSKATNGWWGNSKSGIPVKQWMSRESPSDDLVRFTDAVASELGNEPVTEHLMPSASMGSDLGYPTLQYESQSSNWSGTHSSSDRSISPSGLVDIIANGQSSQQGSFPPATGFEFVDAYVNDQTSPLAAFSSPVDVVLNGQIRPIPLISPEESWVSDFQANGVAAGSEAINGCYQPNLDQAYVAHLLSSDLTMAVSGVETGGYQIADDVSPNGQLPFPSTLKDVSFEEQKQVATNGEFYEEEVFFQSEAAPAKPKLKSLSEYLVGKTPKPFYPAEKGGDKSFVKEFHAALAKKDVVVEPASTKIVDDHEDRQIATGNQVDPVPRLSVKGSAEQQNDCFIIENGPVFRDTPKGNHQSTCSSTVENDQTKTPEIDDIKKDDVQNIDEADIVGGNGLGGLTINDSKAKKESKREQFLRLFKEAFRF